MVQDEDIDILYNSSSYPELIMVSFQMFYTMLTLNKDRIDALRLFSQVNLTEIYSISFLRFGFLMNESRKFGNRVKAQVIISILQNAST